MAAARFNVVRVFLRPPISQTLDSHLSLSLSLDEDTSYSIGSDMFDSS